MKRAVFAGLALAWLGVLTQSPLAALPSAHAVTTPDAGPSSTLATTTTPGPSMSVASQTAWVVPGAELDLRIALAPATTATGTLTLSVYASVPNRSEFERTLTNHIDEALLARPVSAPVGTLPLDPGGARLIRIATQDPSRPRDVSRLALPRTGVYPVRVEYRPAPDSRPTATLVTHLIYVSEPVEVPRLEVAWIVPIHALPHPGPGDTDTLTAAESASLADLTSTLDAHPDVALTLAATPDTLEALRGSARLQDRHTLRSLVAAHPGWDIATSPYVPIALGSLVDAGLTSETTLAMTSGSATLAGTVGEPSDPHTWIVDGPLDDASAAFLAQSGVNQVVVPESNLTPNPEPITPAQPFELVARPDIHLDAFSADPGFSAQFTDTSDPVLAAHQLLADLAVVWLDRPAQLRGVVVETPQAAQPDPAFVAPFLDGLHSSPALEPATLGSLFAAVPPATLGRIPMQRRLARITQKTAADPSSATAATINELDRHLQAFGTTLDPGSPTYARLEHLLLVSLSDDLVGNRARQDQLDVFNRALAAQLRMIQLPTPRTITLTARTGHLPISILSQAPYPLHVLLRVESDKLSFPGQSRTGITEQFRELHHGDNPIDFGVQARAAGTFPLHITVLSPDGRLVLASTTFEVASTALPGIGVGLSVGAALFLTIWWSRHALRTRRSKKRNATAAQLTPTGPHPRSEDPVGT